MPSQIRNKAEIVRRTGYAFSTVLSLIENHDVIAFDVFGTLLSPYLLSEDGVFRFIEKSFGAEGFCGARLKAEQLARRRYVTKEAPDVSLDNIYSILSILLPDHAVTPDDEWECEKAFLHQNESFGMIAAIAREKGKRLVGISDARLSKDHVSKLLDACGIELDALYASLDDSRRAFGKSSGHEFLQIAAREEVAPGSILHFREFQVPSPSDALDCGYTTIHVRSHRDCFMQDDAPFVEAHCGEYTITSDLILGQVAMRMPHIDPEEPDLYSFGFNTCGPLLLGFCDHIAEVSKRDQLEGLFVPDGQIQIIEKAINTLRLSLSCRAISELNEVVHDDFAVALEGEPDQFGHRVEARRDHDLKNVAIVDLDGNASNIDLRTSPRVYRYSLFDQSSRTGSERCSHYFFDGTNGTNVQISATTGAALIKLLSFSIDATFPELNSDNDESLTYNGEIDATARVGFLAANCVQRGALDFLRMIEPRKDTIDPQELKALNRVSLSRLISTPTEREYCALAIVPVPGDEGGSEWKSIGSFWNPKPVLSKSLNNFRRQDHERRLENYDLMLPNSLKQLSLRGDIEQLDWRRIMYRHPLKVSYWNSVRRYQRRKQSELGAK
ncbi:hypothetical protein [Ruegeria arenilitoris]|uniref:hypothetical protein n=1 Tax=Ruegeria arenilitoris TaxID=1173585 RepID=UPI0014807561|nr:hypothetical protein [Ruegeria arenilitoris]